VFYISTWWGLELFSGAKPTKAPRGDGTATCRYPCYRYVSNHSRSVISITPLSRAIRRDESFLLVV